MSVSRDLGTTVGDEGEKRVEGGGEELEECEEWDFFDESIP